MTLVFNGFAVVFLLCGWIFPHVVHRLGFRMAAFYVLMAAISAGLTLIRSLRKA